MPEENLIFVFGSNLAGRHGAGSALHARQSWGAQYGVGVGRTGNSYAIPTKGFKLEILPLDVVEKHVKDFISYAQENPSLTFQVVKIGCGLAGFKEEQIIPFFVSAPDNCQLPTGW